MGKERNRIRRSFTCEVCGKVLRGISSFEDHLRTHTGDKFLCNYCAKQFTKISNLYTHLRIHSEIRPFKCPYCDRTYSDASNRNVHTRKHSEYAKGPHNVEPWVILDQSKTITVTESVVESYNETSDQQVEEETCDFDVHREDFEEEKEEGECQVMEQLEVMEPKQLPTLICEICGKTYTFPSQLRDHMNSHTLGEQFKCDQCEKVFYSRVSLKSHIVRHQKPFQCRFCPKRLGSSTMHQNHERTHTGEKPFGCPKCPSAFITGQQLVGHLGNRHSMMVKMRELKHVMRLPGVELPVEGMPQDQERPKPFDCKKCDKKFVKKFSLTVHMRRHDNVGAHKCHYCDKYFDHRAGLEWHENVHQGRRPYKCTICCKGYYNPLALKAHVGGVHKIRMTHKEAALCKTEGNNSLS